MASVSPRLATNPDHVRASFDTFHEVMDGSDERLRAPLTQILPFVHSWICEIDEVTGEPRFAPSKFVGYRDMTVGTYATHFKAMDGRETERVLQPWVRLVVESDDNHEELHQKLHAFCARFGTKPRARCRISILPSDTERAEVTEGNDDDALVELLVKVCARFPAERRREIARRIGGA